MCIRDSTTTTNWLNGGVAAIYANGSAVYFNDSPVSSNIVISSAVTPASVTFANSNATYNVSAATVGISGTASVVKTNAGTVTFSGTNTYTGGTFVNGGTLVFSNGAAIPSTGTLTLNNTGAVTVVTASGPVSYTHLEGDFTLDELKTIQNSGAFPISLGNLVLRVETAAVTTTTDAGSPMRNQRPRPPITGVNVCRETTPFTES